MSQSTQTPGWGPPPPTTPPRKRHVGRTILIIVAALFVLGWIVSLADGGGNTSTSATTQAPQVTSAPVAVEEPSSTDAPTTTAKPKPAPTPKTLLSVSGTGSHTHATPRFTVPRNYGFRVYWSYRAKGLFAGESVNFIMTVEDPDASFSAPDVNELDTHGSGVEEYNGDGTYWISVVSESSWTLKVVAVPHGCLTDSPPSC